MQDLYAAAFAIDADELSAAYQDLARAASKWAWRGHGAPPNVLEEPSGSRDARLGYQMTWSQIAVSARRERALTVELRHPDPLVEGREWRTRIDGCLRPDSLAVTVRVAREAIELRMTPAALTTLRRPGLVRDLLNNQSCAAGGLALTARPAVIYANGVEDLVAGILRNPLRALPVVITAASAGPQPSPDAGKLADELAGLAHVVQLGGYLAWLRFREFVGDRLFVPQGGARIYWPGFGGEHDYLHHRYWTRRSIEELRLPFHRALFALLTRISVHAVPSDPLPAELRRAAAEARLKDLVSEGRSDAELLQIYVEENERLRVQVEGLHSLTVEQESELRIHRKNYAAMAAGALAEEQAEEEAEEEGDGLDSEAIFEPKTWAEFVENLDALEGPAFVITPNARDVCNPCIYRYPTRMWRHLELLAEAAEAWAAQGGTVGTRLEEWIHQNYGIEIALHDSSLGERGRFTLEGKEYSREPHVKVDDYKGPDECGRIYFAYVAEESRFIVDHIGPHL